VIEAIVVALLQSTLVSLASPLVVGVLRTLKARLVGRRGPSPLQPYADIRKLFAKEPVVSTTTSWVFRLTPYVLAGSMLLASVTAPVVMSRPPLAFAGILLLMSLFLLGTFFLALAGLDAGSAFGGMGSSRAVAVAALAEPTVLIAVLALALRGGTTNLGGIIERLGEDAWLVANPGHLLAFAAFFMVMIAETGRLPVDNPSTHLELTMIHEAMVLEYSGHYLAFVEWASAMKLFLFVALLANLFIPWGIPSAVAPLPLLIGVVLLLGKVVALLVALALVETSVAKLRLFRVPELLCGSFALALLSVTATLVLR
jgi:formate hydrogenlyase subunit 4